MKKRALVLLFSCVIAGSILAGCGDDSKDTSTKTKTESNVDADDDVDAEDADAEDADSDEDVDAEDAGEEDADDSSDASQDLGMCYAGITNSDSEYAYLGFNGDDSEAILIILNGETGESVHLVGPVETDPENNMMQITDEESGVALGFSVEQQDDGNYLLDAGDAGAMVVGEISSEDFQAAVQAIQSAQ